MTDITDNFPFNDLPVTKPFDMRRLSYCPHCYGEGAIFEGAWMNSNPSSYADYEEIWSNCDHCGGKGWDDKFFSMAALVRFLFPPQYEEESIDAIPF